MVELALAAEPAPLLKLDIGCGQNPKEGFEGCDIVACEGVKYVFDATKRPWPFEDQSVGEVHSSHFVEHIPGGPPVEWGGTGIRHHFFDELWRVMAVGAKAMIITPYWSSMRAIQDFTHAWPPICEASYLYWGKKWREENKLSHYPVSCDFDFTYGYNLNPSLAQKNDEYRQFAVANYVNAAADLVATLTRRA